MVEEQEKGRNGMRKSSLWRQGPYLEGLINWGKKLGFVLIERGFQINSKQCQERNKVLRRFRRDRDIDQSSSF